MEIVGEVGNRGELVGEGSVGGGLCVKEERSCGMGWFPVWGRSCVLSRVWARARNKLVDDRSGMGLRERRNWRGKRWWGEIWEIGGCWKDDRGRR